jgi:hypothetical protein
MSTHCIHFGIVSSSIAADALPTEPSIVPEATGGSRCKWCRRLFGRAVLAAGTRDGTVVSRAPRSKECSSCARYTRHAWPGATTPQDKLKIRLEAQAEPEEYIEKVLGFERNEALKRKKDGDFPSDIYTPMGLAFLLD